MSVNDPGSRTEKRIKELVPDLEKAFLRSIHGAAVGDVEELLEDGYADQAVDELLPDSTGLADSIIGAYFATSYMTAAWLRNTAGASFSFDPSSSITQQFLASERARILGALETAQRESILAAIREASVVGADRQLRRLLIRDSLGLTRGQWEAVQSYRRLLEQNSSESLSRALRDHKFDLTVQRAIRNDTPLSTADINRIVDRYREKMLQHRAKTIAHTEAVRSINHSIDETYNQAIDKGVVSNVMKRWITSGNERRRPSHVYMHGQTRPQGQPFLSGAGYLLMYPGDPDAPGSEVINCVCVVTRTIGGRNV
jgi:hypothetical protein